VARGSDVWAGRVVERQKILDFIVRNNINGVVFLSGDKHWAGAFKLRKGNLFWPILFFTYLFDLI
jgi:phosphodiesterase/alkaline phosphatase D-like protein